MSNFLIVGGSSGIGSAIAQSLSSAHNVYASYYKNKKENYANLEYFYYNIEEPLDQSFLPESIDGLAYCPGAIKLKPFHTITEENFIEDYKLQVLGAVKTVKQILPRLKASGNASIVLFSSVAVQTGFSYHSLVSSSKGAIEGLTKALAAEFAPTIRVNCIAPSLTDTPLSAALLSNKEKKDANALRHPLKRIGTSTDIANLATFLLSDKASWITGQIFHVDGGISTLKI